MRNYETILVVNPELSEGKAKEEINNIKNIIQNNAGSDIKEDFWGKKEIAHKIGKYKHGFYCSLKFNTDNSSLIAELTRNLRIFDNILKYQTFQISTKKRKFKGKTNTEPKLDGGFVSDSYIQ